MAGRKKLEMVPQEGPDFVGATPPAMATQELILASATSAYAEDRDLINQLIGETRVADAFEKFSRTVRISKLAHVKESKLYKGIRQKFSERSESAGTWEGFCELIGISVDKADEDIKQLKAFGADALETMSRAGIGYRELRQLRRLPEDEQTALIAIAETGDKTAVLHLAEDLISRQAAEKAALRKELEETKADIEAKDERLASRDQAVNKLQDDLAKARRQWKSATPDEQRLKLERAVTDAVFSVRAAINPGGAEGGLQGAVLALAQHAYDHELDVGAFLGNVFGELLLTLRIARDHELLAVAIPIVKDGAEG